MLHYRSSMPNPLSPITAISVRCACSAVVYSGEIIQVTGDRDERSGLQGGGELTFSGERGAAMVGCRVAQLLGLGAAISRALGVGGVARGIGLALFHVGQHRDLEIVSMRCQTS